MEFSKLIRHLIRENEPLAPLTWLKIGGEARYLAEPNTVEELCQLLVDAKRQSLPVRLLGGGSNVLVRESGFDGLVIHLSTAELCKIEVLEDGLMARGGAKLNHVISAAVGAGLAGLEHLAGIPGTVGGAVLSNAGVTNDDIGSRVRRVTAATRDGQLVYKEGEALQFGFRRSNLEDLVIVEVELSLDAGEAAELTRRMQTNWIVKRAAQPQAGVRTVQVFIEPDGTSLDELLDAAGMKGIAEGEVSLNPNHPGYLTVAGKATSEQVLALIERVTKAVEIRSGIQLPPQLKIW